MFYIKNKPMSHYFFTDISRLSSQTTGSEFGPAGVTSSPIHDKYRVTSLHKASANTLAYAVCKSILFVQENSSNANLVNIVLKPLEQPPFNLPKVKFYIYKGVKKSSLIDGNNIATDTDLYDSIILDYAALNTGATTAPKEILGITASVLTTDSISSVFNEANFDHQLPVVKAGDSIGMFDKDGFGFEIHLEAFGFEPTIAEARTHENTILVPQLPSTPTQAEFFEHWHDKEVILNYLDPCAYWGSFFELGIKVFSGTTAALKKESNLVTEVLAKFTNKNKVYIDIRNEFNFSINYFKNYGTSATNNTTDVKLTKGSSVQTTVDYYGNNWPILILDGTGFGTTSNNHQVLGISLPCGNGDNPEPIVYVSKGLINKQAKLDSYSGKKRFVNLDNNNNWTSELKTALYWSGGVVAGVTFLKFCKRKSTATLPSVNMTQIRRDDEVDCIFRINPDFNYASLENVLFIFEDDIYLESSNTEIGMYGFLLATDGDIVMFSRYPTSINLSESIITLAISSKESIVSVFDTLLANANIYSFVKSEYESSTDNFYCIESYKSSNSISPKLEVSLNSLLTLMLSRSELNSIVQSLLNSTSIIKKFPIYITFSDKTIETDDSGRQYKKNSLSIKAFTQIGQSVEVQNFQILSTPLKFFSNGNL